MKKTILHIIDDLGRGGAETMLVKVLRHLKEYNNVVVTLYPTNDFGNALQGIPVYCLNLSSKYKIPSAAAELKKIIQLHQVELVHSHLFWSTVVARLGTPKKVPLLTTIHAFVASSVEYQPWHMRWIERITYRYKKSTIIAVAKGALQEYFQFMKVKPHKALAVYTFVDTHQFKQQEAIPPFNGSTPMKLVTVGNLKTQKDHAFLLEVFKQLKDKPYQLDIYGKGNLEASLQQTIQQHQLTNVRLMGVHPNIQTVLPQYHLFVMSSLYEGFALGVLEAMAMRMPLLLTDIPSFREQCADTALYAPLKDVDAFIARLDQLYQQPELMQQLGKAAQLRVHQNFTLPQHLEQLKAIYQETLQEATR